MPGWIEGFLFGTIWGLGLICLPVIGLAYLGAKKWPNRIGLFYGITGIVVVGALLTLPSVPRYLFAERVEAQIAKNPFAHVVNKTRWGDVTEPLTWFNAPYGSFFVVLVDPQLGGISEDLHDPRMFRTVLARYDEPVRERLIEIDCDDREYKEAAPDSGGTFRNTTRDWQEVDDDMYATFCEYDWPAHIDRAAAEYRRLQAADGQ